MAPLTAGTASRVAALALGCILAGGVLELGLRLVPGAISPRLLILFEPQLRSRIAGGSLMVREDFTPLPRDDQGPPLYVRKPRTRIVSLDEGGPGSQDATDEIGFCNEPGLYRESEALELIAIGDSFTWCHAVRAEQGWVAQLGARSELRAYNLGRGGSGPYEYLQLLRHYGLPKRPRIVVLNVYEGNDLRDAAYYWEYRRELERTGEPPAEEPEPLLPALSHGALGRHSYLANLTAAFLTRAWRRHTEERDEHGIDFEYALQFEDRSVPFNTENRDTDEVVHARRLGEGSESLELWDDALAQFGALAREHGFAAVVTYSPSAHTAYGERVRFDDAELGPLLAQFSRAQREFLAQRAAVHGYAFHDLTPALAARAQKPGAQELLYDPSHIHFTPAGHAVVADSLAAFLRERELAPAR